MKLKLDELAKKIDHYSDISDSDQLSRLVNECLQHAAIAKGTERVILHYFESNAHAALRKIKCADENYLWGWEQPEAIAEILALRRAIADPAFVELDRIRRCQIKTNLGNLLNHIGRPVEAIEQWDDALLIIPEFAMALGNRALGLYSYGRNLYDNAHRSIFLAEAHQGFSSALQDAALWDSGYSPEIANEFQKHIQQIEQVADVNAIRLRLDAGIWTLGDSPEEIEYRKWCLANRLFLDPLNDLGESSIAASDVFHLPDHTYEINEEPRFVRFYDLLKQEFVGARTIYFESIKDDGVHFSDREVLLFDHFDGGRLSLKYEKLKLSFRATYSIFDKISVFMNEYFDLRKKPNSASVSFRQIWYAPYQKDVPKQLEGRFSGHQNWPLRGLFSLSKDIYDPNFQSVALPDARLLDDLRNAAEHRFLSIHEYDDGSLSNDVHQRITVTDFQAKTMRLLKLARAALIYLSLAVRREENLRSQSNPKHDNSFVISVEGVPLARH